MKIIHIMIKLAYSSFHSEFISWFTTKLIFFVFSTNLLKTTYCVYINLSEYKVN